MFQKLLRGAAALALFAGPLAHAQEAPATAPARTEVAAATRDADPAIWVVKDADTTIYLFGTVHVLKPGFGWFDEAVHDAFEDSDELVLEMIQPDMNEMQSKVMQMAMQMSGPSLRDKLGADYRDTYKAVMEDLGLPVGAFDRFEPWFAAMTLSVLPVVKMGYDPNSGVEHVITEAATEEGKKISALETVDEQLGFFDTMPEEVQIAYLKTLLDGYDDIGPALDETVEQWADGNPEKLGELINEGMIETPGVAARLLTERNQRWAIWIDNRMDQPGTVFVAVGAGHLAGHDSVQEFLKREHGLTAERIEY